MSTCVVLPLSVCLQFAFPSHSIFPSSLQQGQFKFPATEETADEIGLSEVPTQLLLDEWEGYKSLAKPPGRATSVGEDQWVDIIPIYRGLVPAKSLARRDIAVNGAAVRHSPPVTFSLINVRGIPAALSKRHLLMGSLCALDIVLLFG